LSGVIWYQGEANSKTYEDYDQLFRALITQWRNDFKNPQLPFFWCNLAPYRDKSADPSLVTEWANLRLKQTQVLDLPHTGEAILTDAGEMKDIHPRNKKVPGERLAALALARVYGRNIPCTGPAAVKAVREKNAAVISFKDVYDGLEAKAVPATYVVKSKEGKTAPLKRNSPDTQLEGFALCGKDGKWFWADKAVIRGKQIVLSSAKVQEPVKVRCGLQNNPTCNLYNKAGFPVVPFEISVEK
jgi:sialate O-acetylesterase